MGGAKGEGKVGGWNEGDAGKRGEVGSESFSSGNQKQEGKEGVVDGGVDKVQEQVAG